MTSSRAKLLVLGSPLGGWDSFHSWLIFGSGWILWLVASSFLISMPCPVITPITCGLYMHPSCSRATVVVGTGHCLSGSPDLIHTKVLRSVPLSFTIASSDFCAVVCARAHTGLADISMVRGVGFAPLKETFPVTVAAFASFTAAAGAAA